jgi:hypothetical protein
MCLLVTGQAKTIRDVFINTQGLIDDVYSANPDGVGVMHSDGRKLSVSKFLPKNAAEVRQFIMSLPNDDRDVALHFRLKTHGLIDMENCHPYRVNNDTWLAHNGVLHTGNAADPDKSDTWHFIDNYLSSLPTDALHDKKFLALVGAFIGNNRFAIMSADGRLSVVNREQGIEAAGVWFSNTYAWSPALLIPAYRTERTALYPHTSWAFNHRYDTLDDLWGGVDEPESAYDGVEAAVYDALENYDETTLEALLSESPEYTVRKILSDFELKLYGKTDMNELTKYMQSLVCAWLGGDYDYLVKKAKHDPASMAQALLYYCDWTWVLSGDCAYSRCG